LFQFQNSTYNILSYRQLVGPLGGGSARRKAVTYVGEHKQRKMQTYIHALGGIRTHDLNIRAGLDGMVAVIGRKLYSSTLR
jgi:hypothetical protein